MHNHLYCLYDTSMTDLVNFAFSQILKEINFTGIFKQQSKRTCFFGGGLIFKTSKYHQTKVLNERISEWTHLSFIVSLDICIKVQNRQHFFRIIYHYEILKRQDKISNFWAFNIDSCTVILQYLLNHLTKIVH